MLESVVTHAESFPFPRCSIPPYLTFPFSHGLSLFLVRFPSRYASLLILSLSPFLCFLLLPSFSYLTRLRFVLSVSIEQTRRILVTRIVSRATSIREFAIRTLFVNLYTTCHLYVICIVFALSSPTYRHLNFHSHLPTSFDALLSSKWFTKYFLI